MKNNNNDNTIDFKYIKLICNGYIEKAKQLFYGTKLLENYLENNSYQVVNGELWLDIIGTGRKYKISNMGRIFSVSKNKIMSTNKVTNGYKCITIRDIKSIPKTYTVHRLVAIHFVKNNNPKQNNYVDHIDNNRLNNQYNNLRWTTLSGNTKAYYDNFYTIKKKTSSIIQKLYKDEIFKNIGIIDGRDLSLYEISNYGKIKSLHTNNLLSLSTQKAGYLMKTFQIKNSKETITLKIHRLVAMLFCEGRTEEKNVVNHIDKNKSNNYYKNLEWTTDRGNALHAVAKKVYQIDPFNGRIVNTFDSISEASEKLGNGKNIGPDIVNCCSGNGNICYGYKWRYVGDYDENKDHKIFSKVVKIQQYDLQNNLIKEWSIKNLLQENINYKKDNIVNYIDDNAIEAYGYKWITIKKDKNQLKEDEEFKNLDIIDDLDFSDYEISNYGAVKNIITKVIYEYRYMTNGAPFVTLKPKDKNNKTTGNIYKIDYLVALKFISNNSNKKYLKHLDGNLKNNYYKNLEWTNEKPYKKPSVPAKEIMQLDSNNNIINKFRSAMEASIKLKMSLSFIRKYSKNNKIINDEYKLKVND